MISSLEAFPTELCTASVDNDDIHSYPQVITACRFFRDKCRLVYLCKHINRRFCTI